ncbi:MAG: hypothetical protein LBG43_09685 [Treponema sp.]|nr:hypothetical protein [Treponema sp.]
MENRMRIRLGINWKPLGSRLETASLVSKSQYSPWSMYTASGDADLI